MRRALSFSSLKIKSEVITSIFTIFAFYFWLRTLIRAFFFCYTLCVLGTSIHIAYTGLNFVKYFNFEGKTAVLGIPM